MYKDILFLIPVYSERMVQICWLHGVCDTCTQGPGPSPLGRCFASAATCACAHLAARAPPNASQDQSKRAFRSYDLIIVGWLEP